MEIYGRAGQAIYDNIVKCMRFLCWITKAIDTDSECVMFIAFPRQQLLLEGATISRYM
jgi:hypothetical protein